MQLGVTKYNAEKIFDVLNAIYHRHLIYGLNSLIFVMSDDTSKIDTDYVQRSSTFHDHPLGM